MSHTPHASYRVTVRLEFPKGIRTTRTYLNVTLPRLHPSMRRFAQSHRQVSQDDLP